ncbi:polysaccharide deacetylase [Paenibacillus caui]|uniref:polysaccharide deacetylase n=1 Tax=Paenibacillus caui TaxID=2873927 RepID=UPI001F3EAA07|nr:polysaccharide deacetylase [Paenibacillus caui]
MYRKSRVLIMMTIFLVFILSVIIGGSIWSKANMYKLQPAEAASLIPARGPGEIQGDRNEREQAAHASAAKPAESVKKAAVKSALATAKTETATAEQAKPQSSSKTVYLTFDDGPSKLTKSVLQILDQFKVKATFFVIGKQAESSPELIRQIADGGHAVGNHTYDHDYDKLYHNFSEFWGQIKQTEEILRNITGYRTSLVRAPGGTYGHFDKTYFSLMAQAGYQVFDWDVDSGDSARKGVPSDEILKNATENGKRQSVVLLMHDGSGHDATVKALPQIIRYYKDQGYRFAPLTPEVKPVQFHTGGNLAKGRTAPDQAWIDSHIVLNAALFEKGLPLTVTAGGVQTKLEPGEYELREGALFVPLRATLERLGAEVAWSSASQRAEVKWNGQGFTLLPRTGEIVMRKEGEASGRRTGKVELRNDAIWISLRGLLEALGHPIAAVHKSDKQWTVRAF